MRQTKEFRDALKQKLKEGGFTRRDLAESLDVPYSTISSILNGYIGFNAKFVAKVLKFFKERASD